MKLIETSKETLWHDINIYWTLYGGNKPTTRETTNRTKGGEGADGGVK